MRAVKRRGAAFTLIELLVVISIIAVLLAMVMPSMTGIRDKAQRTTCMSNQRQLALAVISCATDNSGMLPYANWGQTTTWGPGWAYDPARVIGALGNITNLMSGACWPYIKDVRVYRCPKDPAIRLPRNACNEWKLSSFVINGAVVGYSSGGRPAQYSQFHREDVLFWENAIANFAAGGDMANYPLDQGVESLEPRHMNGGCYAAFDGHGGWVASNEYSRLARSSGRNQFWCNPRSATGH